MTARFLEVGRVEIRAGGRKHRILAGIEAAPVETGELRRRTWNPENPWRLHKRRFWDAVCVMEGERLLIRIDGVVHLTREGAEALAQLEALAGAPSPEAHGWTDPQPERTAA